MRDGAAGVVGARLRAEVDAVAAVFLVLLPLEPSVM
jgi:hypothetical protein